MNEQHIADLNHPEKAIRLEALAALVQENITNRSPAPEEAEEVNNHIHTFYSFSPYSPAKAAWSSNQAGLGTAGIMDHDSISGAEEFIEAGRLIGLATTIGVECRCSFDGTALQGRRINNPDQDSVAYVAMHGIPHTQIQTVKEYFRPFSEARNERNRDMIKRINERFIPWNISLDYDEDVLPLSQQPELGSITERHLLFALSRKMIERCGRGSDLIAFLEQDLKLLLSPKAKTYLANENNPHLDYDLLGTLKSDLVQSFYIEATEECPPVKDLLAFGRKIGVVLAYAYIGDVGDSVTGDKKSQKFEDDYLDELFTVIKELNFQAVTYMPTRNTVEQLSRVQALCRRHDLFQISGVDINSPRQSFNCPQLRQPEYRHLVDATWALIGHEIRATRDLEEAMFSPRTVKRYPLLSERIAVYKKIGLQEWR